MVHRGLLRGAALVALAGMALPLGAAPEQLRPPRPAAPKLEPVAETRLLMEGLAQSNFRGLEKILKDKPADAETWTFARGQALLIAETGNLLLMRPPKTQGQDVWMQRAIDLRGAATALARQAGGRDLDKSRAALLDLAGACNRCHQSFRVTVRIGPQPERDGE